MCLYLNIVILLSFGIETWHVCDIYDESTTKKDKLKCIMRFILSALITGVLLFYLYKVFGVSDDNLMMYIQTGKTG
jgi:hypothetical protein